MYVDWKTQYCQGAPNVIYRLSTIPIKITASYFEGIHKPTLKFIRKDKRPRVANTILKEKNKVRGLTSSDFKT